MDTKKVAVHARGGVSTHAMPPLIGSLIQMYNISSFGTEYVPQKNAESEIGCLLGIPANTIDLDNICTMLAHSRVLQNR